jgi:hypothetical protein
MHTLSADAAAAERHVVAKPVTVERVHVFGRALLMRELQVPREQLTHVRRGGGRRWR